MEMGRPEPSAAALIRQQARDIDELWDRLSRAYAVIRRETPSDDLQREIEQLRAPAGTTADKRRAVTARAFAAAAVTMCRGPMKIAGRAANPECFD